MKLYKEIIKKELNSVICDFCGNDIKITKIYGAQCKSFVDSFIYKDKFNVYTQDDDLHVCEKCYNKFKENLDKIKELLK